MQFRTKLLCVMKLTAFFILCACLQVSAGAMAQRVSLHAKNASIGEVFSMIKQQTGYHFIFNDKDIDKARPVTIELKNVSVEEALTATFKDQPLTYEIKSTTVFISPGASSKNSTSAPAQLEEPAAPPPPAVRGRVMNENGEPVAGVTITIKGSAPVAITNEKGEFALTNVDPNAILVFTAVNMETYETRLRGRKELVLNLTTKMSKLDEVVAIAYGTSSKRKNTGSVGSISSEDIARQPVANPLNALEGRIAGAYVTQSSGLPGSNVNILIRGTGSLGNGTIPLYIIDGVPFNIQNQAVPVTNALNSYGLAGANGNISPFSVINPSDIERIDILKDADATAIYGTRAANGVVLITTKKGKAGKTKLDVNVYQGAGKVAHYIDMLSLPQYLALRRKAFANDGITPTAANAPDLFTYDTTKSTDWQKKYLGGTAATTDAQATVSGGDMRTRFLLNAGYHRESTVMPGNQNDQRLSVRFFSEHNSLDRRFNAQISATYSYDQTNLIGADYASSAYVLPPDYPLYNSSGSLFWDPNYTNPQSRLSQKYIGKTNNLIASTLLRYTILPGLDLKTNLGFTKVGLNQNIQNPISAQNPSLSPTNNAQFGIVDQQSYTAEPQLTYSKKISMGLLNVLAGGSWQRSLNTSTTISATNYSNPGLLASVSGAATYTPSGTYTLYKYNAFFGRVNYSWQDRYILNGNIRRDGSSRFGPGHRFGTFGSVGGAWIMSNESFFKPAAAIVSFAKLRGSYGITGNDQITDYQFLATYATGSSSTVYQGTSILSPSSGVSNPDLHWETNKKLEFGLDLGFIKDRILLTANYYRNRSDNQLSYLALPDQTGYNSYTGNFKALLQNKGFEFELNTKNIVSKNFTWRTSLNLTIPRNKLLSVDRSYFYASSYILGHSIHQVLRYTYQGIDPATGQPLYRNATKDTLTFTPAYSTDRSLVGEGDPTWYGGMQNEFQYKGWNLSFFIQVTRQRGDIYPSGVQTGPGQPGAPGALGNVSAWWLKAGMWQNPGDKAGAPRASTLSSVYSYLGSSSFTYGDNSFVKLRNISLSYTLPAGWVSPLRLTNCRIYLQAQNVLTLTKNKVTYDPETGTSTPPLRVITFGINCSL